MQHFSEAANLDAIWQRDRPGYDQLIRSLRQPISETLVSTDLYLRRNLSGYVRHDFVVYVEPLAAPSEVNSRNYAEDYYTVISPTAAGVIRLDQLRHTYLHYILDAKVLSRGTTLERLAPLLESVHNAPLEDSYRFDMGLLLTESLIRAIEARLLGGRKGPDNPKEQLAWDSTRQGFILTRYFYDKLVHLKATKSASTSPMPTGCTTSTSPSSKRSPPPFPSSRPARRSWFARPSARKCSSIWPSAPGQRQS